MPLWLRSKALLAYSGSPRVGVPAPTRSRFGSRGQAAEHSRGGANGQRVQRSFVSHRLYYIVAATEAKRPTST
jgi:hypothetical protein